MLQLNKALLQNEYCHPTITREIIIVTWPGKDYYLMISKWGNS